MIFEIRVISKNNLDSKGQDLLNEIKRTLNIKGINKIRTVKVYRLEGINKKDVQKFVDIALYESIDQIVTINKKIFKDARQFIAPFKKHESWKEWRRDVKAQKQNMWQLFLFCKRTFFTSLKIARNFPNKDFANPKVSRHD